MNGNRSINYGDIASKAVSVKVPENVKLKEPKETSSLDLLKANLAFPPIQKSMLEEEDNDTILQSLHHAVYLYLIKDISAFDIIISTINKGIGNWSSTLINSFIIFKSSILL